LLNWGMRAMAFFKLYPDICLTSCARNGPLYAGKPYRNSFRS
jgi:hypothetical protein